MPAFRSLADSLGVDDPRPATARPQSDFEQLIDVTDPKEFCRRILETREFRQYIMNGIVLGSIQPAIMGRIIDHAWGKAPDRIEHTGKDGQPIVTEVRRVIVHAREEDTFNSLDDSQTSSKVTH